MRSLFLGLLVAACSPPASYEEPSVTVRTDPEYFEASVKARCAERYPADYMMRGACARNARRGRDDFLTISAAHQNDSAMQASLTNCFRRYTTTGVTDFMMLGACARNQERGMADYQSP